ncbi:MAG TPA: prepilin peptidase [Terriglobales bacterium]|nr:prepilin peptidase [Terriglobales bacterium]
MDPVLAISFFVFGLAFGSFLNVCIHRLPRRILLRDRQHDLLQQGEKLRTEAPAEAIRELQIGALDNQIRVLDAEIARASIVAPASACPSCKTPIHWYDNVPVVSWLVLRGRCRHCKSPISPRYLAVEVLTGLLFVACYARFGVTLSAAKYCALCFLLLGLIFTDAEHHLLPDGLTLSGLAIGLLFSLFVPVNDLLTLLLPGMVRLPLETSWRLLSLADALAGAVVGASFIYGAGVLYLRARGVEGMGFGDVKLMAMVGSFLGLRLTVFTMFGASLAGSLVGIVTVLSVWMKRTRRRMARNRETPAVARKRAWQSAKTMYRFYELPFGVFLGAMAMLALFFGNALLRWYWGLYL